MWHIPTPHSLASSRDSQRNTGILHRSSSPCGSIVRSPASNPGSSCTQEWSICFCGELWLTQKLFLQPNYTEIAQSELSLNHGGWCCTEPYPWRVWQERRNWLPKHLWLLFIEGLFLLHLKIQQGRLRMWDGSERRFRWTQQLVLGAGRDVRREWANLVGTQEIGMEL